MPKRKMADHESAWERALSVLVQANGAFMLGLTANAHPFPAQQFGVEYTAFL